MPPRPPKKSANAGAGCVKVCTKLEVASVCKSSACAARRYIMSVSILENMNEAKKNISPKHLRFSRLTLKAVLIGFIAGIVWFVAMRVILFNDTSTHYHANFALYIQDQRDAFGSFTFYEEIQSCSAGGDDPKSRVHMHDNIPTLIHVHDAGVTWGHFFANLGYGLGEDYVQTDAGVFIDSGDEQLRFILNGDEVSLVNNQIIGNEDTLLISYGNNTEAELLQQFNSIPTDSGTYNSQPDPSSCSGSDSYSFSDRLRIVLGLQ